MEKYSKEKNIELKNLMPNDDKCMNLRIFQTLMPFFFIKITGILTR